jgi:hypothetical protein
MTQPCEFCKKNKKLLIPFSCKCDYKVLCGNCRAPEEHKCTFDFKKDARDKLTINNPKIEADKLTKI